MTTTYFISPEGRRLAFRATAPSRSDLTFVWLSGFKSDMSGTKVTELEAWARAGGHGFLAFDYSGHGESGGAFEEGDAFSPFEQLMSVFPPASGHALPAEYRQPRVAETSRD